MHTFQRSWTDGPRRGRTRAGSDLALGQASQASQVLTRPGHSSPGHLPLACDPETPASAFGPWALEARGLPESSLKYKVLRKGLLAGRKQAWFPNGEGSKKLSPCLCSSVRPLVLQPPSGYPTSHNSPDPSQTLHDLGKPHLCCHLHYSLSFMPQLKHVTLHDTSLDPPHPQTCFSGC